MLLSNSARLALVAAFFLSAAACAPQPPQCAEPISPKSLDGSSASEAEMHQAHDAVVRFQKESYAYQSCLVDAINGYIHHPPFFSRFYDDGYVKTLQAREDVNQAEKRKVVNSFNNAAITYNKLHPDQ